MEIMECSLRQFSEYCCLVDLKKIKFIWQWSFRLWCIIANFWTFLYPHLCT